MLVRVLTAMDSGTRFAYCSRDEKVEPSVIAAGSQPASFWFLLCLDRSSIVSCLA